MSIDTTSAGIHSLTLPSGGYAMVALDQRESMRNMFQDKGHAGTDQELITFKRTAAAALAPHASAILMDSSFSTGTDLEIGDTPLILAVDRFDQPRGSILLGSVVDRTITPEQAHAFGASALKQLVLWHADEPPAARRPVLTQFLALCHAARLPGIVEGVVRPPADPSARWDRDDAIVAAAAEAAQYAPDLYKAEVPAHGRGDLEYLRRRCAQITDALGGVPWVVLSSGVNADDFPQAVRVACAAGASGFLAGRAIWASCVGAPAKTVRDHAVRRLRHLVDVVERATGR